MVKTFTLRVDLESDKGIKAVPKLLDLLRKYDLKASFYVVMGGESNLLEILRYRGKITSSDERKIKIWSLKDKIRMVFFPRDFVKSNFNILKRILKDGHELGIHGWKHREWTRGLDKIDIEKTINKAVNRYNKLLNQKPISFAAPGFNTNQKVLEILEKRGIRIVSDFESRHVRFYGKIKNIPITICGERRAPIIEYMVSNGKKDLEILEFLKKDIKKKEIASFYIHGLFEARFKLNLLEDLFKFIKREKIKNKRIIDY